VVPGNLTEDQVLEVANDVIGQFAPIPKDKGNTFIEFYPDQIIGYSYDLDTGETTADSELSSWEVGYFRTKDGVVTEDSISVFILPNGDCRSYHKVWNMDLDNTNATFSVTEEEAQDAAVSFLGSGKVLQCEKKIVRPNHCYSGTIICIDYNDHKLTNKEVQDWLA